MLVWHFALFVALGAALVILVALRLRGRTYARFAVVIAAVQGLIAIGMFGAFSWIWPVYLYLQLTVVVHLVSLTAPRMRPWWWRATVSVPALFFVAASVLALPWAIVGAFGITPYGYWLPYLLAGLGALQSLWTREEEIDLSLDKERTARLCRYPRGKERVERPLRVVQITDPHLGPFMSVRRLRRICERTVARKPDLVLLTGDFLTMESQARRDYLHDALAPLREIADRTFACFGNHDHEAPDLVRGVLAELGIGLLIDEEAVVDTPSGPVQLIGADFVWRERAEHLKALCARHPRRKNHLRVILLHDPGAFRHLPEGEGDLVLSGHTHGGQLGLVSLGLPLTFVSAITSIPDHGFWARGPDRLYVHRGTGVYGFPVRLGVPGEQSVLRLHRLR